MDKLQFDEGKIKIYANIQTLLCSLEPNSSKEAIDNLIKQIPQDYLNQKEELKMISQLFAQYGKNSLPTKRGNVIKLFSSIMPSLKKHLPNESPFFWEIFGSLLHFKLWFFQEGLISIDQILAATFQESTPSVKRYFYPEIYEYNKEIFDKEIRPKGHFNTDEENINEFKDNRQKFFNFLRDSNDFNDPIYEELVEEEFVLTLKTDNLKKFKAYFKSLEYPVDLDVIETDIENFYIDGPLSLIDFAIYYNSVHIFDYLLEKGAPLTDRSEYYSIISGNDHIMHEVNKKVWSYGDRKPLLYAIEIWNDKMTRLAYDFCCASFLTEENVSSFKSGYAIQCFKSAFLSKNFIFFDKFLIPFIKKNSELIEDNFNNLALDSIYDLSCFFVKPFLNNPLFEIDYDDEDNNDISFLSSAISKKNQDALELLLKNPDVEINELSFMGFTPFQLLCLDPVLIPGFEMLSNHPNFNIEEKNDDDTNALDVVSSVGNFIALQFIVDKYPDIEYEFFPNFYMYLKEKHYYCLKILLKLFIKKNPSMECNEFIKNCKDAFGDMDDFDEKFIEILQETFNELK